MDGILSMAGDRLKYDPLKEDSMQYEYDPLGNSAGKRVATYDKDYGFSMLPEQKAVAETYKYQIDDAATKQQEAIDQYKTSAQSAMSKADETASGILSTAKSSVDAIVKPSVETVPVRVVNGNTVEATYNVPRSVADELAAKDGINTAWVDDGKYFNVDVRADGGSIIGKEIHDMLRGVSEQVTAAEETNQLSYDTAKEVGNSQVASLEGEVASQRKIATDTYDQAVSQGESTLQAIKDKWTTFLTNQRDAFQSGITTNNGGIADMINSGALVMKGNK